MGCIAGGFFALLGLGLLLVYGEFCFMQGGWKFIVMTLAITVASVLLICIVKLIKNIISKHPLYMGIKAAKLNEAKKLDEANILKNQASKAEAEAQSAVAKEKRVKEIDELLPQLQEEFEDAKKELNEAASQVEENDCLGEEEKNIQVIEMLIYFIESRRADSIKEALHEYDKAMTNKQMVELEEKRLALQKSQMEKEANDRKKLLKLQEEANDRARWAAMDNARQRDQLLQKLDSLESFAISDYYRNL